jgi:hypothetical protein
MQKLLGCVIFVLGMATVVLIVRRSSKISKRGRGLSYAILDRDQAGVDPYPYIYVNVDGSARELHPSERNYLETPFLPADGGRPYVKGNYSQKNGWGEIAGFLKRSKLPQGVQIVAAPEEDPSKFLTKENQIQFLRAKGMEVTENSDGGFTVKRPNR